MKVSSREILRLAIPSIFANITVPLVGMADLFIAGHLEGDLGGAAFIGGISVGTMLFDLLYWPFAFLRSGTGGLTAQAYGRGGETGHILGNALRTAMLSGLLAIALQWFVLEVVFLFVNCSGQVRTLASSYFHIRIWAAPATLSLFAFKGWFIGMQDSVRPMTSDLIVNILNIVSSLALAFGIPGVFDGLGFKGIAIGTVIAQWCGFLYCTAALARLYPSAVRPLMGAFKSRPAGGASSLNRDLILRSVGMMAVYIGFTVISAGFGDTYLAVCSILMKLLMLFSYFTDGFAYAAEALSGRFIGAGSRDGFRSAVRGCFAWGGAVMLLFMCLYWFGGRWLFGLMTSDATVVQASTPFIAWMLIMPIIGCPAFVWDGVFIGATSSKDLRDSTLWCAVAFFAVYYGGMKLVASDSASQVHVLMAAYFSHLAVRSIWLTIRYPSLLRREL